MLEEREFFVYKRFKMPILFDSLLVMMIVDSFFIFFPVFLDEPSWFLSEGIVRTVA